MNIVVFSNVIPVRGVTNSILCDLQKNSFWTINDLAYNILKYGNKQSVKSIIDQNSALATEEDIMEYLEFFEKKEIIFFTKYPEYFPDLDLIWDEPFTITNVVIDFNIDLRLGQIVEAIGNLAINTIQLRFYSHLNCNDLTTILNTVISLNVRSIEIIMPYDVLTSDKSFLKKISFEYNRLSIIVIYDAPLEESLHYTGTTFGRIFLVTSSVVSEKSCGLFSDKSLIINFKLFTESKNHNSCLNRKISIDADGNIKNCPSMSKSYGNVRDTTLAEAIEKPGFKKYWNINKDQIAVCKDCEFRYICTDCRAYVEDPLDASGPGGTNLSKPLKCGYDPYTGEWAEWSTNPLKQKAIEFYGMQDLVKSNEASAE